MIVADLLLAQSPALRRRTYHLHMRCIRRVVSIYTGKLVQCTMCGSLVNWHVSF